MTTFNAFRPPDELTRLSPELRVELAKILGSNAPAIILELEMVLEVSQPLRDAEDHKRPARVRARLAKLRKAAGRLRTLIEESHDEIGRLLVIAEIDKGMDAMPTVPKHPDPQHDDILRDTLKRYIAEHPQEDRTALSRLAVRAGEIESVFARVEAWFAKDNRLRKPKSNAGAKTKEARDGLVSGVGLVLRRHGIEISDSHGGPAARTLQIVLAAADDHLSRDAVRKLIPGLSAE